MAKQKIFNKDERKALKGPDQFMKQGTSFLGFFIEKKSRFLPIVIGILGVYLVVVGYDWYRNRALMTSWTAYSKIYRGSADERWAKLEDFYSKEGSGRPALLAAVELGDHYFEMAKGTLVKQLDPKAPGSADKPGSLPVAEASAKAVVWYEKALGEGGLIPIEKQLLHINLGQAYELKAQNDEAIAHFEKAAAIQGEAKAFALLNTGRLWEAKGDREKAKEIYQKVSVQFSDSEFGKIAKSYIRFLNSGLSATGMEKSS